MERSSLDLKIFINLPDISRHMWAQQRPLVSSGRSPLAVTESYGLLAESIRLEMVLRLYAE